jgi:ABC-type Zn uptake system ZnuABC Zn-binding protein ZnuA
MVQRILGIFWYIVPGVVLGLVTFAYAQTQGSDGVLRVVATVPELGSLAREVGGEQVVVTVLVKGTEDPHFIEARPAFIKALSQADVYIQVGLDQEIGWAPVLLQQARNGRVLPGAPGYIDASTAITPLQVSTVPVDRSQGDVHAFGNPHFLVDPIQGLKVARLVRDRLAILRPQQAVAFEAGYTAFRQRLSSALVGEALAAKYDVEKLALLADHGRLEAFLQSQGEANLLGGWLGRMRPYAGTKAVADHNVWPYFAQRFQLTMIGFMEPKPGLPPTTHHLHELINLMQAQKVPLILASAYYDPRHARFLAQHTGAKIVEMANQVGARTGTDDYFSMIEYNVQQCLAALGGA